MPHRSNARRGAGKMHEPPLVVTNTSTAPVFVLVSFSCAAAGGSNKNATCRVRHEDWKELLRGLPVKMRRGSVCGPCHSFWLAIGGGGWMDVLFQDGFLLEDWELISDRMNQSLRCNDGCRIIWYWSGWDKLHS